MKLRASLLLPLSLFGLASLACSGTAADPQLDQATGLRPLHREGGDLVDDRGERVLLQGIGFGNDVWGRPSLPVSTHHGEADFARVAELGMNLVRFYLNYDLFEDDAEPYAYRDSGWAWLDANVAWAKRHGVYLILNMHVPQGGFQSIGAGDALWTEPENQERLIALWRAIAERYRDEPTIAGYDLLNEPRPPLAKQQWIELATRIGSAIRAVDPDHLLVVERLNSIGEDWSSDEDMNFFVVPDENVLYEFHFYEPIAFTHQNASWLDLGDGGRYPDTVPSTISTSNLVWYGLSADPELPPSVPEGTSDWSRYESPRYALDDPKISVVAPVLVAEDNAGMVYFDDVTVTEWGPDGDRVGDVVEIAVESRDGWFFVREGTSGTASVSTDAHRGSAALTIANSSGATSLTSTRWGFVPKPGHRYSVAAWMRGEDVGPAGARGYVRLDFFHADGGLLTRDRAGLERALSRYVAWGEREQVPLFLGEFGLIEHAFAPGKGGAEWVRDMLAISRAAGVHYSYHVYHEQAFGLFRSDASSPPRLEDANQELLEVFRETLTTE